MDHSAILSLPGSERISVLKEKMLDEPRYVSIEQARIVTEVYQQTEGQPPCISASRAAPGPTFPLNIIFTLSWWAPTSPTASG